MYIYIYMYIEREREGERYIHIIHVYIYIYIYEDHGRGVDLFALGVIMFMLIGGCSGCRESGKFIWYRPNPC